MATTHDWTLSYVRRKKEWYCTFHVSLGIGIITNHTFSRAPYIILKSTKNEVKSVLVFLPKDFINKIHSIVLFYGRKLLSEITNKKKIPTESHTSIKKPYDAHRNLLKYVNR